MLENKLGKKPKAIIPVGLKEWLSFENKTGKKPKAIVSVRLKEWLLLGTGYVESCADIASTPLCRPERPAVRSGRKFSQYGLYVVGVRLNKKPAA